MEKRKTMTTEQIEAKLKYMRIKATITRVLAWCAVAAIFLSLAITQNLLIALGFLVIALVFGIPAGRAIRKRDEIYELLGESVINDVIRDVLGDGVEYNPVGALTPGSVAVPFHYTHSSGKHHIKTVCNGVNIELGSIILYEEYEEVDDVAYRGIQHNVLFRGPWLICDFGKKPACDVYISEWSKKYRAVIFGRAAPAYRYHRHAERVGKKRMTLIFIDKMLSLMTITREQQPDHPGRKDRRG